MRDRLLYAWLIAIVVDIVGCAGLGAQNANIGFGPKEDLPTGTHLIYGCEGEGCGCTYETVTKEPMILYRKMNKESKVLGFYKKNIKASAGAVYSVVVANGEYVVKSVTNKNLMIKVGEHFSNLFYLGEGSYRARLLTSDFEFMAGDIDYEKKEPSIYEIWTEVAVGNNRGFTNSFPFHGCLGG